MYTNCAQMMDFSAIIQNRGKFDLDLSACSLVDVLNEYSKFKRKTNPDYKNQSVISNLQTIEVLCGGKLMPIDVTDVFYGVFRDWMSKKGLSLGTQKLYCNQMSTALGWSSKHNCRISSTFDSFEIPDGNPITIALSAFEVSHIANFDISRLHVRPQKKRTLEKVRDHFCLSCNLGQRYSDMIRISKENFNNGIFTCVQQKTGNKCRVDLKKFTLDYKYTLSILDKYGHNAPFTGNINNYNKYLHELIEYIGEEFGEKIKIETKINGELVALYKERFKMIASHTARRTFATYNRLVRKIDAMEIMRATGHKSLDCFKRYIREEDD